MPDRTFILPTPVPWYRWIGPWPFRPVITLFLSAYFFIATNVGVLIGEGSIDPSRILMNVFVQAIPAACALALFIWVGQHWQRARGVRPLSYVVFIFLAASAALFVRSRLAVLIVDEYANVPSIALVILRFMLMIFTIMAVSGAVVARLQQQVNATESALRQVRNQQTIMVEADEAARRQVAALLHDRVQAGLIAACLELQMIAQRHDPQDQQSLRKVIDRLEELRALDVRRAARALSPSLDDVDLTSALEELAAQYEPSIETHVRVTPVIEERRNALADDLPIAIYRIVEQALLNAATHGQAQHVWIDVEFAHNRIELSVRDDGLGLADTQSSGLGSAVIETWTRVLSGTWELTPATQGGTILRAQLAP